MRLPASAHGRSARKHRKDNASKQHRIPRPAAQEAEAFVVEVKRRLNSAKNLILNRLGLYGQLDEMPLGLIIDVWI